VTNEHRFSQPESPAFENREDRGSLSYDGVGKTKTGYPLSFCVVAPDQNAKRGPVHKVRKILHD